MRPRPLGLERLPQAIAEQVVRRIVEVIDIDEIVGRIDVDDIVRRIDVDAVMARVDVEDVMRRIDPNVVLDRVDVDRIVERIDVNAIAERIDVDELVRRADLGPLIAQSTTGMLGEFLVLLRRRVIALDDLLDVPFRRRKRGGVAGPTDLLAAAAAVPHPNREGQYAGGATRLLALVVDVAAGWGLFLALVAAINAAVGLVTGTSFSALHHRVGGLIGTVVWGFAYFSVQWLLSGRTVGMAILGARVVTTAGHSLTPRSAAVRTVVLPVSIALFFVGLVGIFLRSDRRALHDLCAGTCVVYHWQARSAFSPWHHDAGTSRVA